MQEFLEFVVSQLIDRPEELMIHAEPGEPGHHRFTLVMPQSEVGKVIGKQGHTIRAIRGLMVAAASRHGERVTLDLRERAEA